MSHDPVKPAPGWMTAVLRAAAVYNVLWGAAVILLPDATLGLLMPDGEVTSVGRVFWQSIGMIVGVYGVGYWIAGDQPYRHWPIVLVGLLGKLLGPIGFVDSAILNDQLPVSFGMTILTNDLIWWVPFGLILAGAFRDDRIRRTASLTTGPEALDVARAFSDVGRDDLASLSKEGSLLVVFLRHFGCTFCRETLGELSRRKAELSDPGVRLVLVHMVETGQAERFLARYDLPEHELVSDPQKNLYRAFSLRRGTIGQMFGPRVWLRGIAAGLLYRHGIGSLMGDGFQMPGVFRVSGGRVVRAFRHRDAADQPDYELMCSNA